MGGGVQSEVVSGLAKGRHCKASCCPSSALPTCIPHPCCLSMLCVQVGLGRTGKLWGHQHHRVEPDMMTLAKPLAGGPPALLRPLLPLGPAPPNNSVEEAPGMGPTPSLWDAASPLPVAQRAAALVAAMAVAPFCTLRPQLSLGLCHRRRPAHRRGAAQGARGGGDGPRRPRQHICGQPPGLPRCLRCV